VAQLVLECPELDLKLLSEFSDHDIPRASENDQIITPSAPRAKKRGGRLRRPPLREVGGVMKTAWVNLGRGRALSSVGLFAAARDCLGATRLFPDPRRAPSGKGPRRLTPTRKPPRLAAFSFHGAHLVSGRQIKFLLSGVLVVIAIVSWFAFVAGGAS